MKNPQIAKRDKALRRASRTRKTIVGKTSVPRLSVFRSAKFIYAQIIDDSAGKTLVSANDVKLAPSKDGGKVTRAAEVGKMIAEAAKKAKITKVIFDRGPYKYHGRVKALAEAARKNGLEF